MKNNVIVLGGGSDQAYLIKKLKKRGYYTILIDYYENPIAKKHAHIHLQESSLDYEKVKAIAIEWNAKYVLAVCTDQALYIAAKISEELGLYFPLSSETALNVTNKRLMKKILVENNIPTAKAVVGHSIEEIQRKIEHEKLRYPLVVKPVDANSSKGVTLVNGSENISIAFNNALVFSREKSIIVEEFINGREISIDGYVIDGEPYYLMATESKKLANSPRNDFPISKSIYNQEFDNSIEKIAWERINDVCAAFHIYQGPLLLQCIFNNDNLYIIELSARTGGGSKIHFIKKITTVDVIECFIKDIEKKCYKLSIKKNTKYANMVYIYSEPGRFKNIKGLPALKKQSIIESYFIYKNKNMNILGNSNSSDRLASILLAGNSINEIDEKLILVKNNIQALDNNNNLLNLIIE